MRFLLTTLAAASCVTHAACAASCDAPETLEAVKHAVIAKGTKDSGWVFRLHLNVPAYRIREVQFTFQGAETIGPWRNGVDCQVTVEMATPLDVLEPNIVTAKFNYVVTPNSAGGTNVELY